MRSARGLLVIGTLLAEVSAVACASSSASAPERGTSADAGREATRQRDSGTDRRPSGYDGGHAGSDASRGSVDSGGRADDGRAPFDSGSSSRGLDAGCFVDGALADSAPVIYGSCRLAPTDYIGCIDYGAIGGGVDTTVASTTCTSAFDASWSASPCNVIGAVFGCEQITAVGNVCATANTTWYFPPATTAYEATCCPPPGVVVSP